MFIKAASYPIPEGKLTGWRRFFLRRDVIKAAQEFGISFEEVQRTLEKAVVQNPGKTMVIVFSQTNDEPATMLVEEREAHFQRIFEQVKRTGIFTVSSI